MNCYVAGVPRWDGLHPQKLAKIGNYIQSSSKFPQIIFFKAWISFSQGEFLLADCEVLAYA